MNRRQFHAAAFAVLASTAGESLRHAGPPEPEKPPSTGNWNLPIKTLGGKQFWADQLFFHGWRIQKNSGSGHHRLLDDKDIRYAWGSFEQCQTKLDQIRRAQNLPPMQGKAVVVIHGLGRSRSSMIKMAAMLRQRGKYTVFNVSYPSTRYEVAEHAKSLARVIESLDGITEINFVCHSLGNLIVRHWLGDVRDEKTGRRGDQRIRRMVMLGPPNHQPKLAATAAQLDFTGQIGGKTLAQLAKNWHQLEPHLATPEFEFAILAGGKGNKDGYNPLIPGDDDLVVSVASTKLAGARDFRVLPVKHTFMMDDKNVHELTLQFLQKGWFESERKRVSLEHNTPP